MSAILGYRAAAAALLGGLLWAGCADTGAHRAGPQPAMRAMGDQVTVPAQASDESLGREIRRRLNLADPAGTAGIIVEVVESRVLLRGVAPSIADAWRAEAAARSVAGVREVSNQILIQP